jgi:hypothetical protein
VVFGSLGEGMMQAMWGIIGKIKMFDRLAKSAVGGAPGGCLASLCGVRATAGILI